MRRRACAGRASRCALCVLALALTLTSCQAHARRLLQAPAAAPAAAPGLSDEVPASLDQLVEAAQVLGDTGAAPAPLPGPLNALVEAAGLNATQQAAMRAEMTRLQEQERVQQLQAQAQSMEAAALSVSVAVPPGASPAASPPPPAWNAATAALKVLEANSALEGGMANPARAAIATSAPVVAFRASTAPVISLPQTEAAPVVMLAPGAAPSVMSSVVTTAAAAAPAPAPAPGPLFWTPLLTQLPSPAPAPSGASAPAGAQPTPDLLVETITLPDDKVLRYHWKYLRPPTIPKPPLAPFVYKPPAPPGFWMWNADGLTNAAATPHPPQPPLPPPAPAPGPEDAAAFADITPGKPPQPAGVRREERYEKLYSDPSASKWTAPPVPPAPSARPALLALRAPETGAGRQSAATGPQRTVAGGRGAPQMQLKALEKGTRVLPAMPTEAAAPGPA